LVDPNTRQGKRTPVTLKIKFKSETLEQFIERYAVDVSQGGIFIRTKEPLPVGTQMKFEFQLRDASPLIAGEGTVVWTRENDPSRPAIAPGMGVRFDRLADGSQGILERILTDKAKQAPQRPAVETSKPPMFTDTPTRVAPTPMQEALLGKETSQRSRRNSDEPHSDQLTPLPRPMPFHSDADEFPDEAFEEATKVRALDELIAQTADGSNSAASDEHFTRRGRGEATLDNHAGIAAARLPEPHEAPNLPTPPQPSARPQPRLLDTSPSPRSEAPLGAQPQLPSETLSRTRLGVEPARADVGRGRGSTPPPPMAAASGAATNDPAVMRAVAAEQTEPARMPAAKSGSNAPLLILILLMVAVGGAAVWFFILRPQEQAHQRTRAASRANDGSGRGSAIAATGAAGVGSGAQPATRAGSAAPQAELVDTAISVTADGATITIAGTDQSGPSPFTAKLERGKPYRAKVVARGYMPAEVDVKGGEPPPAIKLVAKPRVISIVSEPPGAVILVDGAASGHSTPFDIELNPVQAAKRAVRIQLRKPGYRAIDRLVEPAKLTEDDSRMTTKLDERLAVAAPAQPRPPAGSGSARGSDDGTGSAAPEGSPTPTGSGHDGTAPAPAAPAAPAPPAPAGSSTLSEPEPDFTKPK
jgi:uncharacterized protein (TIGR02266 family)